MPLRKAAPIRLLLCLIYFGSADLNIIAYETQKHRPGEAIRHEKR
jgi:hypothetical protein